MKILSHIMNKNLNTSFTKETTSTYSEEIMFQLYVFRIKHSDNTQLTDAIKNRRITEKKRSQRTEKEKKGDKKKNIYKKTRN